MHTRTFRDTGRLYIYYLRYMASQLATIFQLLFSLSENNTLNSYTWYVQLHIQGDKAAKYFIPVIFHPDC